ncbi:uncharacterized protein LOC122570459 isoform X2 [Bombus pyrosoma]|uniref:uncharacterized protein LOC122570459 isoform X2 n=1 Tax=Bombus pyrosoma TaxID=396416 RepID=UPI001CB9224E|nr:uncharacterized protein LOC122570459 isoform X2 [Bombus pyrosoma]
MKVGICFQLRLHLILSYSNRTEKALKEKDSKRRETEEKKKILEKKEDRNQVLPCFSKTIDGYTPRTTEEFQNNKECSGNNTIQESLLLNETHIRTSNPEARELIVHETTTNNMSKDLEETETF